MTIEEVFETAKKEGKPILLDFTAKWCSTCFVIDKIIETEINPQYGSKIAVVKIDVNEDEGLTGRYNILSIPALILLMPDRKEIWRNTGLTTKEEIKSRLNDALGGG